LGVRSPVRALEHPTEHGAEHPTEQAFSSETLPHPTPGNGSPPLFRTPTPHSQRLKKEKSVGSDFYRERRKRKGVGWGRKRRRREERNREERGDEWK
jgi:hypothetical protein